jgi:hypothetical protein
LNDKSRVKKRKNDSILDKNIWKLEDFKETLIEYFQSNDTHIIYSYINKTSQKLVYDNPNEPGCDSLRLDEWFFIRFTENKKLVKQLIVGSYREVGNSNNAGFVMQLCDVDKYLIGHRILGFTKKKYDQLNYGGNLKEWLSKFKNDKRYKEIMELFDI